jgi:hypothetical protein
MGRVGAFGVVFPDHQTERGPQIVAGHGEGGLGFLAECVRRTLTV